MHDYTDPKLMDDPTATFDRVRPRLFGIAYRMLASTAEAAEVVQASMDMRLVEINGEPGLLRFIDGVLEAAQTFETDGRRILRVNVQRNPDKLARIASGLS